MMDGAFFVGRGELLTWVNQWLRLNVEKIEQCANGAVYCQIVDSVYPGKVPMKKVNWMAKRDHEFIPNYKILQAAFDKIGVQRNIDVDKLIRAKYQDNLEFLQWLKCFFDSSFQGGDYPATERRTQEMSQLPPWAQTCLLDAAPTRPRVNNADKGKKAMPPPKANRAGPRNTQSSGGPREAHGDFAKQQEEITDLRTTVEGLENERDYYFGKLREIEILTQTLETQPNPDLTAAQLLETLQKILYKDDEEEADEGEGEDEGEEL